jgi:putative SOS response-associated peptidase YedK
LGSEARSVANHDQAALRAKFLLRVNLRHGFFEWRAVEGARAKQPYAIEDGSPFGLAGLWENWRDPNTGEWERTFAIITVPSNELVGQIHDRMPAILEPRSYHRWLGPEPDPHDLLITYPSEPMTMWPISTRVNKPENDDPSLLDRTGDPFEVWAPLGEPSVAKP